MPLRIDGYIGYLDCTFPKTLTGIVSVASLSYVIPKAFATVQDSDMAMVETLIILLVPYVERPLHVSLKIRRLLYLIFLYTNN